MQATPSLQFAFVVHSDPWHESAVSLHVRPAMHGLGPSWQPRVVPQISAPLQKRPSLQRALFAMWLQKPALQLSAVQPTPSLQSAFVVQSEVRVREPCVQSVHPINLPGRAGTGAGKLV